MITIDRKGGLNSNHLVIIKVIVHGLTRLIAYIDSSAFSRVCLGRRRNVRPSFTDLLRYPNFWILFSYHYAYALYPAFSIIL